MTDTEKFQRMIDESRRIVFFGGAGVSTESGIPDFRSVDGLYNQHYSYPPEVMLSHSFYRSHTKEFFDFYRNKMLYLEAEPNPAHKKLAQLEQAGRLSAVVTQNIDGLHQKAGSKTVYELHGSVHRNYCQRCHKRYDAEFIRQSTGIPICECGGVIKPDVVLYEEGLNQDTIYGAVKAIQNADMLIVGGTSLAVYPAAGLIDYYSGNRLVLINKTATPMDAKADLTLKGSIGEILEKIRIPEKE
ncbi:NAD-dependent protein deacetylase [Caprobacter fermentans]|uniref:NAD-dependent protein deacetylase n=1 Tax=Caproicibacter fermentans TaxID=2576756 RepID=A0A6N8HXJ5_9FIRM|nr:NAD-dependent protein deacylase [Caproicibacter fermentans]MVB10472.1 NAD-dependent protein deacetylase [Caproicibacter fermentans]